MKIFQLELWQKHKVFPRSLVLRVDGYVPLVLTNDYDEGEILFRIFKKMTKGHAAKSYDLVFKPYDCDNVNDGEITQLVLEDEISKK